MARPVGVLLVSLILIAAAGSEGIHLLNDANFYEKVKEGEWLVVFTSFWCGMCKELAPIIEGVSKDPDFLSSGIKLAKVDINTEPTIAREEKINVVPHIYFYCQSSKIRIRLEGSALPTKVEIVEFAMRHKARWGQSGVGPDESELAKAEPEPRRKISVNEPGFYGKLVEIIQQQAKQRPIVFGAIVYCLGLAHGLFFAVVYKDENDALFPQNVAASYHNDQGQDAVKPGERSTYGEPVESNDRPVTAQYTNKEAAIMVHEVLDLDHTGTGGAVGFFEKHLHTPYDHRADT